MKCNTGQSFLIFFYNYIDNMIHLLLKLSPLSFIPLTFVLLKDFQFDFYLKESISTYLN